MFSLATRKSCRSVPARNRSRTFRPRLEALEDRCLLNAGALDPTFGNGGIVQTPPIPGSLDDEADRAFVLPTGQLMVVGTTQQPSDYAVTISRYQANGTLDTTFGNGTGTVVTALTSPNYISPFDLNNNVFCQPDGSITIGWGASGPYNSIFNELTRYTSNGSLDTGFGTNGVLPINISSNNDAFNFQTGAFAVQPDGKILITGGISFGPLMGVGYDVVYVTLERLNSNGSLDTTFNSAGPVPGEVVQDLGIHSVYYPGQTQSFGDALAVQPDGTILVGGGALSPLSGATYGFVARFLSSGSLDTSFHNGGETVIVNTTGPGPDVTDGGPSAVGVALPGKGGGFVDYPITSITLQPDGKMLLYPSPKGVLIRLNQDGTLDSRLAPDGNGTIGFSLNNLSYFPSESFTSDQSGGLLIPQYPQDATGNTEFALAHYNSDGSPDLSFGSNGTGTAVIPIAPGADSYVQGDVAVQSDGKIVAVGTTSTDNKQTYHFVLVRLQGGTINVTTQAAVSSQVNQIVNTAILSGQPDQVSFQVSGQADVNTMLAAINALAPATSAAPTVTVTLDLGGGSYSTGGVTVNPPAANVNFVIQNGTLDPSYPALTVAKGQVTVLNCTLLTTGDAPTILVTGGHLTLRNDIIQESTGFSDAAISVTGGTLDAGTASDPGGNTINVNGTGAFVHNTTSNPVAAVGDTFTVNGIPLAPSSLSGFVFEDFNDDGQLDFGEKGISGVKVTLTGIDDLGNAVTLSQLTDSDGAYMFLNLRPGNYTITETQPAGYLQGIDSVGTAGGILAATDQFFVRLGLQVNGLNYNYGAQPPASGSLQHGQTAGIGFWNNKNGQALIKALPVVTNADGSVTSVANWLAATLPHMFGIDAGGNNLTGKSNAYVAALFQQDFLLKGVKLDAQVLATALSVYVTNATLDSTQVAAQYGFTVSGDGVGTATVNIGSNGDAFGVANNTTITVMDLLLATDTQAVDGVLYNGDTTKRKEANNVFSAVNQAGGIN
jgi:uncharacterized delta-60 repeat protein